MPRDRPLTRLVLQYPAILAITFLSIAAANAARLTVTFRAIELGAGPFEVGLIVSAFAALSLFAGLPAGRWVDKVGERHFIFAGCLLGTVAMSVALAADSLVLLGASQALLGLGQVLNAVATQALLANATEGPGRDERFGQYAVSASLGQLTGPALVGILAGSGIALLGNTSAVVFLVALGMTITSAAFAAALPSARVNQPGEHSFSKESYIRTMRSVLAMAGMKRALMISIAILSSIDLLIAYLPVLAQEAGISVETVGILLSLRAAASMVSRLFMGRLIRSVGHPTVLAGSLVLAAVAMTILPTASQLSVLAPVMVLLGLGLGVGQPMTIAWVANSATRETRGTALGVRLTGNRFAQLTVPAAMGALASAVGPASIFWVLAAALGASAYAVSYGRRGTRSHEERGSSPSLPSPP